MSDALLQVQPILSRFQLNGRVALVTGAAQGIGRAFAHALGEAGAKVAVVDMNPAKAETVAHELAQKHIDALPITADVTQPDSVGAMVEAIVGQWGRLDIGVNNAGIGLWRDSETMAPEEWDRVLSINLRAVFLCCQAEARVMLPRVTERSSTRRP